MVTHSYSARRRAAAAIVLAVSAGAASSAFGQTAYFSFQGNLAANGDKEDFGINLSRSVSSAETLRFQTFSQKGGTNAAGEVIAAAGGSGIDSALELFDSGNATRGFQDDINGASNQDSLLSWTGVQPAAGTPLNPNPLTSGNYRLNLIEFGNDATGLWSTDLVGPANAMSLSSVTPTGTATISSLKFGTTGAGASVATFNNGSTLNIAGTLGIGQSGNAALNQNVGTLTVGGVTTISTGGTFNLNGGVFAANGNVVLNGGKLLSTNGAFNLASTRTLTASTGAQVSFGGNYAIGNSFTIQSGSSLSTSSYLDVGSGTNGTLTVTGPTSALNVATGFTAFNSDWGYNGGVANVTISNQATATLNTPGLSIGSSTIAGSAGTVAVNTAATMSVKNVFIGNQSAGTGTLTVNGVGSAVTQSGTSTLTVGAPTGATGTGTINVQNNGVFTTGTGAIAIQKTGTVNVAGGTFNANGDMTLTGGKLLQTSGTFKLATGKSLTAANAAQLNFTGSYALQNGNSFTIQSGSSLTTSTDLAVGTSGGSSTLVVTGLGSSLNTNAVDESVASTFGLNGLSANVTITDQATAVFNGFALDLAPSSISGSSSNLTVSAGGKLTARTISSGVGSAGTSTTTVTGSNSSITQTGSSQLLLGAASPSTGFGTINVNSSGVFTTGTGAISIRKTGTVNIAGGTFNANGDVTVDGGKLLASNSGQLNLAAGKNLTVTNGGQMDFTTNFTPAAGTTFTISNAGKFSNNFNLDLEAVGADMNVVVDGLGSDLSIYGNSSKWARSTHAVNVTVRNEATMDLNDTTVGFDGFETASATLNILSAAKATIGRLEIGTGLSAKGVVNVSGANSKITLESGNQLILGGATGSGLNGTLNIQNGGTFLTSTGLTTIRARGKIENAGGTFTAAAVQNDGSLISGATTTTGQITGVGTTTVTGGTLTATGGIRQGTLSITGGGKVTIPASGSATSSVSTLTITGTSKLDLTNNALVVKSSTLAAVDALVTAGYNNGDWLGSKITSSTAAANPSGLTAIGFVSNGELGASSFQGITGLDGDDILVKYTYYGDADLNGVVDPDDFNAFLAGFQDSSLPRTWVFGDFDYNNVIDPDDFNLFLAAFQANGSPLSELADSIEMSSLSAGDQQTFLNAVAAVPEPGTLGVSILTIGALSARRRNLSAKSD